jgi:hypothetical protein
MRNSYILVGFEVLTAVSMKIAVFWVVAPCSLVEVYQRLPTLPSPRYMTEAAGFNETLITIDMTTSFHISEDHNLYCNCIFIIYFSLNQIHLYRFISCEASECVRNTSLFGFMFFYMTSNLSSNIYQRILW